VNDRLTHLDEAGRARMVDVSGKAATAREATARASVRLAPATFALVRDGAIKKGDVLTVAQIAGLQAAKRTAELIPLCHPLLITKIDVKATPDKTGVSIESMAKCSGQTGIEMEALTAVSVALLTIYDMCKAVDRSMVIDEIRLIEKQKI